MGEALLVRRGGTSSAFAYIHVIYDSDGVCTCSNGTKTLTARGVNGSYTFHVPSAGTWTLTCTSTARTLTKTATITNKFDTVIVNLKQYVLYDAGTQAVTWTKTNSNQQFQSTCLYLVGSAGSGQGFFTESTVHVEHYSRLCIELMSNTANSGRFLYNTGLYTEDRVVTSYVNNSDPYPTTGVRTTSSINVEGLVGDYVIGLITNGSSGAKGYIYKVWFE